MYIHVVHFIHVHIYVCSALVYSVLTRNRCLGQSGSVGDTYPFFIIFRKTCCSANFTCTHSQSVMCLPPHTVYEYSIPILWGMHLYINKNGLDWSPHVTISSTTNILHIKPLHTTCMYMYEQLHTLVYYMYVHV